MLAQIGTQLSQLEKVKAARIEPTPGPEEDGLA